MATFTKTLSCVALGSLAIAVAGCATVPSQQRFWLADTNWAIDDVNQVDTSGRTDFTARFTGSTFDARFGCRRVSGQYSIRYSATEDRVPIFEAHNAVISGNACTGSFAETIGPEVISSGNLVLNRDVDGRVRMVQPPTGITLQPR